MRRVLLPLLVLPCALAVPERARACSPWDPHVERTIPDSDAPYPAGSAILILGQVLDPEGLQATIDGVPVALDVDERSEAIHYVVWGPAYRALAISTDPAAEPGQTVHIFGELCTPDAALSRPEGCEGFDLQLVATDPDTSPPELALDLWYDVYDHGEDATSSSSCGGATARFGIDVSTAFDPGAEAPLYFGLFSRPRGEPDAWSPRAASWRLEPDDHPPRWHLRYLLHEVEGWLPLADEFCFQLRTEDLAGNPGPSLERCPPCHDQLGEDAGSSFIGPFPEGPPYYDDDSIVPDGYCPSSILEPDEAAGTTGAPSDGGDGSSGSAATDDISEDAVVTDDGGGAPQVDPLGDRGCGCQAAPIPPVAWLILVGIAMSARGGGARRRGCRRGSQTGVGQRGRRHRHSCKLQINW